MPAHIVAEPEIQHKESFSSRPVSAEFHGGDEWSSNGIDFSDYARCGTQQRKQSGGRRLPTPEWALKPEMLRKVIVRMMEKRALYISPQPGTDTERLARAQARIRQTLPQHEATLTKNCLRLVAMKADPSSDSEAARRLAIEVEGKDTVIRFFQKPDCGAGALAMLVYLYYSVGLDSVGVGQQIHMKPPQVRRTLWAMHQLWERMKNEENDYSPHLHINLLCEEVIRQHYAYYRHEYYLHSRDKKRQQKCELRYSPELIDLFNAACARFRNKQRTHCRHGHPICVANAYVSDLERLRKYSCKPCQNAYQARYYARVTRPKSVTKSRHAGVFQVPDGFHENTRARN
jgi:hypothetical protein